MNEDEKDYCRAMHSRSQVSSARLSSLSFTVHLLLTLELIPTHICITFCLQLNVFRALK